MKANKLIARALIVLGFGSVVGLGSSCGTRAQRSRKSPAASENPTPAADTVRIDYDQPIMVLYGIPPSQFNPDGSVRGQRPTPPERMQSDTPATPAQPDGTQQK